MLDEMKTTDLFTSYYAQWIRVYKDGAIRDVTLAKYRMTQAWVEKLIPGRKLCEMTRITYQQLINDYARSHERQTTMDFHHQLKGAILDAVDEGLIERDPTRKVIIKGKTPSRKKIKYLNQFELHSLLSDLHLGKEADWDYFILLIAKTGMRFSEALALTPKDFDFSHQTLSISKTWNYKDGGGFMPTKNRSSVRKIRIDWQTVMQFAELTKNKTLLMIAHRLNTVRGADQILVLEDGQIVQHGKHKELIREEGLYRRFVEIREKAIGWELGGRS